MTKNHTPGMRKFLQSDDGKMESKLSGESISDKEGTFIYVPKKTKIKESFMLFFLQGLENLAMDEDLTGETLKVFLYLLSQLDFENYILLEQKYVAQKLKMPFQNVSRSIKVLIQKEILIKGPRAGKSWSYRLNNFYGWRGQVQNMYKDFDNSSKLNVARLIVDNTKPPKDDPS